MSALIPAARGAVVVCAFFCGGCAGLRWRLLARFSVFVRVALGTPARLQGRPILISAGSEVCLALRSEGIVVGFYCVCALAVKRLLRSFNVSGASLQPHISAFFPGCFAHRRPNHPSCLWSLLWSLTSSCVAMGLGSHCEAPTKRVRSAEPLGFAGVCACSRHKVWRTLGGALSHQCPTPCLLRDRCVVVQQRR